MKWFASALLVVTMLAGALAVSGCGESAEDRARSQGKTLGQAFTKVSEATSIGELTSSLQAVNNARKDISEDVQKAISQQLDTVFGQLAALGDDVRMGLTASSSDEVESAKNSAQQTLQQMKQNATQTDQKASGIRDAFWEGFDEGISGSS